MPLKTSKPRPKSPSQKRVARICSEPELRSLASDLARQLQEGARVFLEGELGAGKSTFARALVDALGARAPSRGSPSFPIMHEYPSEKGPLFHIDFYRLQSEDEIDEAGIASVFWERPGIVLTEWISRFPKFKENVIRSQRADRRLIEILFEFVDDANARRVTVSFIR